MNTARFARGVLLGWVVPLAVVLLVFQLFFYRQSSVPGLAPRPSVTLQDLTGEPDLQAHFDQDTGHPRLVLLVSPT